MSEENEAKREIVLNCGYRLVLTESEIVVKGKRGFQMPIMNAETIYFGEKIENRTVVIETTSGVLYYVGENELVIFEPENRWFESYYDYKYHSLLVNREEVYDLKIGRKWELRELPETVVEKLLYRIMLRESELDIFNEEKGGKKFVGLLIHSNGKTPEDDAFELRNKPSQLKLYRTTDVLKLKERPQWGSRGKDAEMTEMYEGDLEPESDSEEGEEDKEVEVVNEEDKLVKLKRARREWSKRMRMERA